MIIIILLVVIVVIVRQSALSVCRRLADRLGMAGVVCVRVCDADPEQLSLGPGNISGSSPEPQRLFTGKHQRLVTGTPRL